MDRGCGTRRHAAHESQRAPEVEPLLECVSLSSVDNCRAVVEDRVEELVPCAVELVGQLDHLTTREQTRFVPLFDINTTALDEVASEPFAQLGALIAGHGGEFLKVAI